MNEYIDAMSAVLLLLLMSVWSWLSEPASSAVVMQELSSGSSVAVIHVVRP